MTADEDEDGSWDEDEGYSYGGRKRVKLPSAERKRRERAAKAEGSPLIGGPDEGRMHPDFPETHDYLKDSLQDLDLVSKEIWALREEDDQSRKTHVTFDRAEDAPQHTISEQDTDTRSFRARRLRNRAYRIVREKLLAEGYSEEWIAEHRATIRDRVDAYLDDRDG